MGLTGQQRRTQKRLRIEGWVPGRMEGWKWTCLTSDQGGQEAVKPSSLELQFLLGTQAQEGFSLGQVLCWTPEHGRDLDQQAEPLTKGWAACRSWGRGWSMRITGDAQGHPQLCLRPVRLVTRKVTLGPPLPSPKEEPHQSQAGACVPAQVVQHPYS